MLAHIKPRLLTALAALLVAPLAPAQTPANLNDCQADAQFAAQLYFYGLACGEKHDKNVLPWAEQNNAKRDARHEACQKLGMTREMFKRWSSESLRQYSEASQQKYNIAEGDTDSEREQKIAAYCQDEQPRLKKRLQRQFQ